MASISQSAERVRVAIVEPHPLYLRGVIYALTQNFAIAVVGEGKSSDDAVALVGKIKPELLLISLDLVDGADYRLVGVLRGLSPETKIVVIGDAEEISEVIKALDARVSGLVGRDVTGDSLADILLRIHGGEVHVCPVIAARLLNEIRRAGPAHQRHNGHSLECTGFEELSRRELETLAAIDNGSTNKEIANSLRVSESTVKGYVGNLLYKLRVKNRVAALAVYRRAKVSTKN